MNRAGTIGTPTGDGGSAGAVIVRAGGLTVSENGPAVPLSPELSPTETENVDVPVAVGVPEMTPVVGPNESPDGRLPLKMLQVYGAVPPEAVKAAVLYGTLRVPGGRAGATIVSTGVMVQVEGGAAATASAISPAEIVKLYDPIFVGVPLRMPVVAPIVIPGGSAPAETKNEYGGTPPDAVNGADVTGTPTGAGGRTGAAMVSGGGLTVNAREAVTPVAPKISVATTENVKVPCFVGVPEMTPVPEPIDRPGGRLPLATLHLYGGAPPIAVKAAVAYATPTVALGSAGTETRIGAGSVRTVKERTGVAAVRSWLSTTPTTKVNWPVLVGVPLRTPVVELSDMPGGSDPDPGVTDHVKGAVPPAT
jgi:hypothetical protein